MALQPGRTEGQRRLQRDMLHALPNDTLAAIGSVCKNALDNTNLRMTNCLRRKIAQNNDILRKLADPQKTISSKRRMLASSEDGGQRGGGAALSLLPLIFSLLPTVGNFVGKMVTKN